jgi:death-on-curing protein
VSPDFLTLEDVLLIHAQQIERFGGLDGIRDPAVLESAVGQPQITFGGAPVHEDLFEMAAAYLFHLVSNHAFIDGNKRVGLAAALVFLDLNGVMVLRGTDALYELTMGVARGELTKSAVAAKLREIAVG